ncbi:MAG TPA: hypothetical protein PKW80_00120 [Bacteroidales bacterium]|nr:hypothetical protein [Bacteroidales bacterium]
MKKLTQKQLKTVYPLAENIWVLYPSQRKGQAFFNALYFLHPVIADNIRATQIDPFHDDEKLDECINQISARL